MISGKNQDNMRGNSGKNQVNFAISLEMWGNSGKNWDNIGDFPDIEI